MQSQQQMQQMQAQVAMEEQQAKIKLAEARATADEGLGFERMSRIKENQALAEERRAQAHKDEEIGFLNLVKAVKEIEGMDVQQIEQLVNLARSLKPQETAPLEALQ